MRQTAMTQGIEARTEGTRTAVAVAAARSWLAVRWPYLGIAAVVVAVHIAAVAGLRLSRVRLKAGPVTGLEPAS